MTLEEGSMVVGRVPASDSLSFISSGVVKMQIVTHCSGWRMNEFVVEGGGLSKYRNTCLSLSRRAASFQREFEKEIFIHPIGLRGYVRVCKCFFFTIINSMSH